METMKERFQSALKFLKESGSTAEEAISILAEIDDFADYMEDVYQAWKDETITGG